MKQKDIICLENIERIYYFMFVVSVCVVDVIKNAIILYVCIPAVCVAI